MKTLGVFLGVLLAVPSFAGIYAQFENCVKKLYANGGLGLLESRKSCYLYQHSDSVLKCQNELFLFGGMYPADALAQCQKYDRSGVSGTIPHGIFESVPAADQRKTICSITINSNDEREAFRNSLDHKRYKFYELLPHGRLIYDSKKKKMVEDSHGPFFVRDDTWLKRACDAKIQCDTLVVSGHFMQGFYGTSGFQIPLEDLWKKSCSGDCTGVFQNVREVYLFGCNTLASKQPDHRSTDGYQQVLWQDGLDPAKAQRASALRYTEYGLSFSDRMRMMFPNAQWIYGWPSVSPSGFNVGSAVKAFTVALNQGNRDSGILQARGAIVAKGSSLSHGQAAERDALCRLENGREMRPNQFAPQSNLRWTEDLARNFGRPWPYLDQRILPAELSRFVNAYGSTLPVPTLDAIEMAESVGAITTEQKKNHLQTLLNHSKSKPGFIRKFCPLTLTHESLWSLSLNVDWSICKKDLSWLVPQQAKPQRSTRKRSAR